MHFDWNSVLSLAIGVAALVIRHAIKVPRDVDRARLLTTLADDAAAVILNLTPTATWAQILRDVIARLRAESTLPTQNASKIEAAATAALVRLGKTSGTVVEYRR